MISIGLYEPQIPPNTGNIARLAVGLNIPLILVGKLGFSLNDRYLKRAGLDYWEHLSLSIYDDYSSFLDETQSKRKIFASTKGAKPYFNFTYTPGDIIIFGSETNGLPSDIIKSNLENTITIPMPGNVRSLNLSNSAAIIIYHALNSIGYFKNFTVNRNFNPDLTQNNINQI
jgi:tRNA (cytidine/uridine-2'-O-)-methyltransferase